MAKSQYIEDGLIHLNKQVSDDTLDMVVISPKIARVAKSGQFVMVSCAESGASPLLRRPVSIHDINDDTISLLYKVVGSGTKIMSEMSVGDTISIIGPLGQGFKIGKTNHHCLIGGGIGIAPLLHLARMIRESEPQSKITVLEGAPNTRELLIQDKFKPLAEMMVSTDDGSEGHHGFVTELLEKQSDDNITVYTCGPTPMMKAVAAICNKRNWDCQVSLETHMACGIGACLGCSFPRAGKYDGVEKYVHVCKDGPVFDGSVIWE